jgi:anti-sigma factor RsiW
MHNHTQCRDYIAKISDYVDGELSPELCASLERHMLQCENCRIVVDTLRKTIELYQVTSSEDVLPDPVHDRLFARLNLGD